MYSTRDLGKSSAQNNIEGLFQKIEREETIPTFEILIAQQFFGKVKAHT